jgi:hypothetical protein
MALTHQLVKKTKAARNQNAILQIVGKRLIN